MVERVEIIFCSYKNFAVALRESKTSFFKKEACLSAGTKLALPISVQAGAGVP